MCSFNNPNQEKLNEVISQMTALTHAVDQLRAEVTAMKLKSQLIKNEKIGNDVLIKRETMDKNCEKNNCTAFEKLKDRFRSKTPCCISRTPPKEEFHVNGDQNSAENFYLQALTPPSESSLSDHTTSTCASSISKSRSKRRCNKFRKQKRLKTTNANCMGNVQKIDEGYCSKNYDENRKNERLDLDIKKLKYSCENFSCQKTVATNTTEIFKNDDVPTKADRLYTENIESNQSINIFEGKKQVEEEKKTRKLAKLQRKQKRKKRVLRSKDDPSDRKMKSVEISGSSSTNTSNQGTTTCMEKFKQNFGSLCTPCKKLSGSKSSKKKKKKIEPQSSSTTISGVDSSTTIKKPTNRDENKSKQRKMVKSPSSSTTTLDTASDGSTNKLDGRIVRKKNKRIRKSKKNLSENSKPSNNKEIQTLEVHPANSKSTETVPIEIPRTVKISDATQQQEHVNNISTESSFSSAISTTCGSSLEDTSRSINSEESTSCVPNWTTKKQSFDVDDTVVPPTCCQNENPHLIRQRRRKVWHKRRKLCNPFKNKRYTKRCRSCKSFRTYKWPRKSRPVDHSLLQSCNSRNCPGCTQPFVTAEAFPVFHRQTFQNYRVSPSISRSDLRRSYPFSDPTSYSTQNGYRFSEMDSCKNKRNHHEFVHHPRSYVPARNGFFSQSNSPETETTDCSLTSDNPKHDSYIAIPSYQNGFCSESLPKRNSHLSDIAKPQIESSKPALIQRFVNFFSRKSSQCTQDTQVPIELRSNEYPTYTNLQPQYIYKSTPVAHQTVQIYADDFYNPNQYDYPPETERILLNFNESQNAYTFMPVLIKQQPDMIEKELEMAKMLKLYN